MNAYKNKLSPLSLVLGLLMVFPHAALLSAQPSGVPSSNSPPSGLSADQILTFAEQLMREDEYFRAITEYRRFLFTYPADPRRAMTHLRIGIAFHQGQNYADALETFRAVAQRYPETSYGRQALIWQGESLIRQANYASAEKVYTEVIQQFSNDEIGQYARYQRAWTLVYRRQWQQAAKQFGQISPATPLYHSAQRLAEEVLDGTRLPRKSPGLAGLLSGVLPGSGQLYNGRRGDALLAFLLNGLFIVGIVEALNRDEVAIAGALSFFEAGWYAGNVYGAVNGAHKQNRRRTETFLRNLESRFRVQPPEAKGSQTLYLRMFSFNF